MAGAGHFHWMGFLPAQYPLQLECQLDPEEGQMDREGEKEIVVAQIGVVGPTGEENKQNKIRLPQHLLSIARSHYTLI